MRSIVVALAAAALLFAAPAAQAATGPVLVGSQTLQPTVDQSPAGTAEAFRTTAVASGTVTTITVYVDAGSSASKLVVGLYDDASGKPGAKLAEGSVASPAKGAWDDVSVSGAGVTSGATYWIAVLSPSGSGVLKFRDRSGGGRSQISAQTTLAGLPTTWSPGTSYTDGPLAAYASGGGATAPILSVTPGNLSFSATAGGGSPSPASLSVTNAGAGSLSFTASADQPWLSVSPASGSAPATLTVSAATGSLAAGTYTGHVTVTAAGASGSPASIPVTFTVGGTPPPPSGGDWLQIEHDSQRTGFASDETAITPAAAKRLGQLWTTGVDGKVTAQPLFASQVDIGGQTRDVLVVVTAKSSVYALDPATGSTLWRRNLGAPGPNCAIPGGFGISAAPAIDRARGRIYTVTEDGVLHTLSLSDGSDAAPTVAVISNPSTNHVWGGINRVGDTLYIATASDGCDTPPWRGRVFKVDASGSAAPTVQATWAVVPSIPAPNGGGGIWGYGGVSVDGATGNVFAATGDDSNEAFTPYGDRMVALDSALNVLGSFEPTHISSFPCTGDPCDLDFGATPLVFKPNGCPTMVAAGNKDGNLYVFRSATLASNGAPAQVLTLNSFNDWLGSGGVGGVPAWWPDGQMVFVTDAGPGINGTSAGVVGLKVASDCTLSVAWSQHIGGGTSPNSTPTVANGVVYAGEGATGRVYAFDAATGAALWNSGSNAAGAAYGAPIVAKGAVYAGFWDGVGSTDGGRVRAFKPDAAPPPPPPGSTLLGDQTVESQTDYVPGGQAEAFEATAAASGTLSRLSLYVDASTTASKVVAGVYADAGGHPGALVAQGSLSSFTAAAWADVPLPGGAIASGTKYWIAVLAPSGGGRVGFRDKPRGCHSETSAQSTLSTLPSTWTTGSSYTDCPISAYGVG